MVLIVEKIPRCWTILGLFVATILAKLLDGVFPKDIGDFSGLFICIIVGAIDIQIFSEELKEKYFLDYEKKLKSVFLVSLLFGILLIVAFYLRLKGIPPVSMLRTSSIIRYMAEFFIGLLIFLIVIFLQKGPGDIDYRKSHKKTEEFCKKICMVMDTWHDYKNENIKDEVEDLLGILESLREDVEKNRKNENEKNRKKLRKFVSNIIAIENLFKSYYNFFSVFEIPRVINSANYPAFLHSSKEQGISFAETFRTASKSVPEFKKKLSKSRIEWLLVKPLFAFIPECKNYDDLFLWKRPEHNLSIGRHNDAVFLEFFGKISSENSEQPTVIFDLYGKPPSSFDDEKTFISQLKASNREEENMIAYLHPRECLQVSICKAGIETLKEFTRRKLRLELKCLEITDNENSLVEFLNDCYDFYTYVSNEELQKKTKNKYRWYLDA